MANVSVIGAGSFGTSLAVLLHKNGHQVTVWARNPEEIKRLSEEREHKKKLPGVRLPEDMIFTSDIQTAAQDKDFIVFAVPPPVPLRFPDPLALILLYDTIKLSAVNS